MWTVYHSNMKFFKRKPYIESKPLKRQNRFWLYVKLIVSLIVIGGLFWVFMIVNSWFNTHYFEFNSPVIVNFYQPIVIKKRIPRVIEKKLILDYPDAIDTPLKQYICDKFGVYDCKIALAIASAESGLREEAFNINTNGTIDVGIFQINSVHFKQEGCSLKEISDAYKNVDCAYKIWQASGWEPWVAFLNGNFKSKL